VGLNGKIQRSTALFWINNYYEMSRKSKNVQYYQVFKHKLLERQLDG